MAFQHVHGFRFLLPHNDKGSCEVQCSKIQDTPIANLFTSSISHVLYIVDDWISVDDHFDYPLYRNNGWNHYSTFILNTIMHIIVSLTLGFVLLPIIGDNQMMKNWIDFVKIKFHLIENIDWYCMKFEFKTFNWIEYNLIQILQLNWILYSSNALNLNFIKLNSNWAKSNFNSIEEKRDAI